MRVLWMGRQVVGLSHSVWPGSERRLATAEVPPESPIAGSLAADIRRQHIRLAGSGGDGVDSRARREPAVVPVSTHRHSATGLLSQTVATKTPPRFRWRFSLCGSKTMRLVAFRNARAILSVSGFPAAGT